MGSSICILYKVLSIPNHGTGARIVISHPQGRELLEQQRRQFPDVVISDMPDKMTLQNVAADHSFEMIEFVDEPGFYLAVLKFKEWDSRKQL